MDKSAKETSGVEIGAVTELRFQDVSAATGAVMQISHLEDLEGSGRGSGSGSGCRSRSRSVEEGAEAKRKRRETLLMKFDLVVLKRRR